MPTINDDIDVSSYRLHRTGSARPPGRHGRTSPVTRTARDSESGRRGARESRVRVILGGGRRPPLRTSDTGLLAHSLPALHRHHVIWNLGSLLYSTFFGYTMRFESHFKSYFGNVKAFNLKKFKIIAEPVAAMAGGGLRLGLCDSKVISRATLEM